MPRNRKHTLVQASSHVLVFCVTVSSFHGKNELPQKQGNRKGTNYTSQKMPTGTTRLTQ
jgi:hypothetical protein